MIKLMKKSNFLRKERAQTMVEFALVFPIVLLITYGIMELGRMIFIYTSLTSAAREGARYGAATRVVSGGLEQYADCAGIRAAVRHAALLIAIPNDSDISITYLRADSSAYPYACGASGFNKADIKIGYQIQVKISNLTFQPIIGSFLGINSFTIPPRTNTRTILMDVKIEKQP